MKQTAVEFLLDELPKLAALSDFLDKEDFIKARTMIFEKAIKMEKKQIFKAKNVSAKEAYEAGQSSMYCGCYEIDGCTNYEEWLYKKFKSE